MIGNSEWAPSGSNVRQLSWVPRVPFAPPTYSTPLHWLQPCVQVY